MPNSQLITSPDIIDSVLIINADKPQKDAVINAVASRNESWNIYLYEDGDNQDWLDQVCNRVQTILLNNQRQIATTGQGTVVRFGPDQKLVNPADYFNK